MRFLRFRRCECAHVSPRAALASRVRTGHSQAEREVRSSLQCLIWQLGARARRIPPCIAYDPCGSSVHFEISSLLLHSFERQSCFHTKRPAAARNPNQDPTAAQVWSRVYISVGSVLILNAERARTLRSTNTLVLSFSTQRYLHKHLCRGLPCKGINVEQRHLKHTAASSTHTRPIDSKRSAAQKLRSRTVLSAQYEHEAKSGV